MHNASDWKDYGYYYPNSDILAGAALVEKIRKTHTENFNVYKAHARALAWRHSPYNPDVQREWSKIIDGISSVAAEAAVALANATAALAAANAADLCRS
jgi:pyocin large subunit-like protein